MDDKPPSRPPAFSATNGPHGSGALTDRCGGPREGSGPIDNRPRGGRKWQWTPTRLWRRQSLRSTTFRYGLSGRSQPTARQRSRPSCALPARETSGASRVAVLAAIASVLTRGCRGPPPDRCGTRVTQSPEVHTRCSSWPWQRGPRPTGTGPDIAPSDSWDELPDTATESVIDKINSARLPPGEPTLDPASLHRSSRI